MWAAKLCIKDLRLFVHLGCSDHEKFHPQEVRFQLDFSFRESVPGEKTDQIEDALCYAQVTESLKFFLKEKRFSLLEHLAAEVFLFLKPKFSADQLRVRAHKVRPPVSEIQGGVFYEVGDGVQ